MRGAAGQLPVRARRGRRGKAIYDCLAESCTAKKLHPLTSTTYLRNDVRGRRMTLLTPGDFNANDLAQIG